MSLPTIGLALAGWLATTWLAYRWGLRSQELQIKHTEKTAREDRKRNFLIFLAVIKQEVGSQDNVANPANIFPRFNGIRTEIRAQQATIESDMPSDQDRDKLKALVDSIAGMTGGDAGTHAGIKKILGKIDEAEKMIRGL